MAWAPLTHWPFTQQPVQVLGPQVPPVITQVPEAVLQTVPLEQLTHAAPPSPHCTLLSCVTHVVPAQQPLGQVALLQPTNMQAPFTQDCPPAQAAHSTPPTPHALACDPG